jgi:hypothetical protein
VGSSGGKYLQTFSQVMKNRILFLLLLIFFILLRFYPIWGNNFPFAYDNAKDSLAFLQMWTFKKPILLGAVTSLQGLWQGPLWYYILFPINLLLGFRPMASVLTVIGLGGFTLWLFWKYVGKLEALLFSISPLVISTQQTSWSPYFTLFSTAWILVILVSIKKKITNIQVTLLSLSLALIFHAEIAFGFVFVPCLLIALFVKKTKLNLKQVLIALVIFLFALIPQGIFEVRHGFLQTKSVIGFVVNYNQVQNQVWKNQTGVGRIVEVVKGFGENATGSMLPLREVPESVSVFVLVGLLGLMLIKFRSNKQTLEIVLPFIFGSFFLYLFLPFKSYYLIGLAPFWIYLFARSLKENWPELISPLVIIFLIICTVEMFFSRKNYENLANTSRILFEPKREAVEKAYEITGGKPFVSYQYVAEVYDYTYQFIYQYTSLLEKRPVPIEYSYAPGETSYMQTQKIKYPGTEKPAYTILIVEKGDNEIFFPTWWNNQTRGKKIIDTEKINDSITVYKLISDNENKKL